MGMRVLSQARAASHVVAYIDTVLAVLVRIQRAACKRDASYQHLPGTCQVAVDVVFGTRVDHVDRAHAVRAQQARRRAEQAADERPLAVGLATLFAQVRAAQVGQCRVVLGLGLDR